MDAFETLFEKAVPTPGGCTVHSHHSDPTFHKDKAVLIMIHGWPQSKYMFRYLIPTLSKTHRLLIPDLPGYGESTPSTKSDRLTVGTAILHAAVEIFESTSIIFLSHDRGARVSQHMASHWPSISPMFPQLTLVGACLMDIVPYKDQWEAFANPRISSGYFHWSFLARPEISTPMIQAYGGGRFAKDIILKTQGTNEAGRVSLAAGGAIERYAAYYERQSTIDAAAADYTAGANDDYQTQVEDMDSEDESKKIGVPTLVLYSMSNLGRGFPDMQAVWTKWLRKDVDLHCVGIGDGVGHYLPEEAPEKVLQAVQPWLAGFSTG
ncbi:hypothetical protein FH972_024690 [Carpinus fangiana]|uniref:AB hydrolase-1 domain-containing protein n=1 Tax=Carpinus fangiana TaxID=176857 RepID=A0A5N6KYQ5_9ROSI|nr:hypothetical protein FH972_024690 [Carpinus fangiana]